MSSNIKSIYPRLFRFSSPQVLSFMHNLTTPLQRPEFKVELVPCSASEKPIDYTHADKVECTQIGTHMKKGSDELIG